MPPNTHSSTPPLSYQSQKPSKLFKTLVEEASTIDGNSDHLILPEEIEWIDYNLLAKGRSFVQKNYALVLIVTMVADTVGFVSKQIASPVFKNFYPNNTCGIRFLSTFRTTINGWLLSDFGAKGKQSEYIKEIQRVRKLHKLLARPQIKPTIPPKDLTFPPYCAELVEIIKHDLRQVDTTDFPSHLISWEPPMFFTQMDVALVQLGISTLYLYPENLGMKPYDENEEMRGYFHMWAVIGKMLGLQDKYNFCLNPDRDLFLDIVHKLGMPALKMADESVFFSMQTMVDGLFNTVVPYSLTVKALLLPTIETAGIKAEKLRASMGWHDWLCYYNMAISMYLMRFSVVRVIANFFARTVLNLYIAIFLKNK